MKRHAPAYILLFLAPVFDFSDHLSRYGYHSTIVCPRLTRTIMGRMRLINIDTFLRREQLFHSGKRVERRPKVLEFRDDETTEYAILLHRWIDPTEVDYEEMVDLAKMDREEQNEIRGRLGYKKIVDTCNQAKQDGYEWVWIDTCCINKRSSAELSEAINSMYRWYANAKTCYAYLHDVDGSSFPTHKDGEKHPKSWGWPEWFSRGSFIPLFSRVPALTGTWLDQGLATVLTRETEQEAAIFTQAASVDRLLTLLRDLDVTSERLANNEEIEVVRDSIQANPNHSGMGAGLCTGRKGSCRCGILYISSFPMDLDEE